MYEDDAAVPGEDGGGGRKLCVTPVLRGLLRIAPRPLEDGGPREELPCKEGPC
jgi:hypothetical protein